MKTRPLFSIITVTYNASKTVGPTLESIKGQMCDMYEFIVIDGASSDNTVEKVRAAAIRATTIISEPDKGLYDAMNKGLRVANGEYYIFLNAGDSFHSPDTLQRVADTVMRNDFPGIVYGQTEIVDVHRNRMADRHLRAPEKLTLDSFKEGMTVCHQAFIAYRKITGFFDLKYRYSADYEWCIRCLQRSRNNVYIPDVLVDYLYEGETTAHRKASLKERFRIMSHYYGLLPTLVRHIRFIPRYLRRKKLEKNFKNQ